MNSDHNALAGRLKQLAQEEGSVSALARLCDIPQRTMAGYVSGEREPRISDVVGIARRAGVSLEWLATGEGATWPGDPAATPASQPPQAVATDARLIGRLTEKIMLIYKEMGVAIALHQAAERAAREHDRIVAEVADPDDRLIQIGEVTAALRQELRAKAADPSSSKHRA